MRGRLDDVVFRWPWKRPFWTTQNSRGNCNGELTDKEIVWVEQELAELGVPSKGLTRP